MLTVDTVCRLQARERVAVVTCGKFDAGEAADEMQVRLTLHAEIRIAAGKFLQVMHAALSPPPKVKALLLLMMDGAVACSMSLLSQCCCR